jgi:hypothetical protein
MVNDLTDDKNVIFFSKKDFFIFFQKNLLYLWHQKSEKCIA